MFFGFRHILKEIIESPKHGFPRCRDKTTNNNRKTNNTTE